MVSVPGRNIAVGLTILLASSHSTALAEARSQVAKEKVADKKEAALPHKNNEQPFALPNQGPPRSSGSSQLDKAIGQADKTFEKIAEAKRPAKKPAAPPAMNEQVPSQYPEPPERPPIDSHELAGELVHRINECLTHFDRIREERMKLLKRWEAKLDDDEKKEAVLALAALKDAVYPPKAIEQLLSLLNGNQSYALREFALEALQLGGDAIVAPLKAEARKMQDPELVLRADRILTKMGEPSMPRLEEEETAWKKLEEELAEIAAHDHDGEHAKKPMTQAVTKSTRRAIEYFLKVRNARLERKFATQPKACIHHALEQAYRPLYKLSYSKPEMKGCGARTWNSYNQSAEELFLGR